MGNLKVVEILKRISGIPKNENMIIGKRLDLWDYYECKCGRMILMERYNYAWGVVDTHDGQCWFNGSEKIYEVFNLLKEFYEEIHGNKND